MEEPKVDPATYPPVVSWGWLGLVLRCFSQRSDITSSSLKLRAATDAGAYLDQSKFGRVVLDRSFVRIRFVAAFGWGKDTQLFLLALELSRVCA